MNDLDIRRFEEQLVDLINSTPLPLEVKRLIVADVYSKIELTTNQSIKSLLMKEEETKDGNSNA